MSSVHLKYAISIASYSTSTHVYSEVSQLPSFLSPQYGEQRVREIEEEHKAYTREWGLLRDVVTQGVDADIAEVRAEATTTAQKETSTPTEFHRYNRYNSSAASRQRIRPPRRLGRRTYIQSKGDVSKEESAIYDKNATKPSDLTARDSMTKEMSTLQENSAMQEESSTKPKPMTVHTPTEKDRESTKANKSGQEEVVVKATHMKN